MLLSQVSQPDITKVDQMQANLIAYFRLFAGLPTVIFTDEDVTWLVSTNNGPGNHILRTQISQPDIERRIDEIINQISQYTDHIDWLVFPGCQPTDLGKRLEARGLQGGPGGIWMLADLTTLPQPPAVPANFHIRHVSNNHMLKEWATVSAKGFESDTQIYDAYARHGFGPNAFSLHYIGYWNDEPVTSSTLLLAGGIASIYDVSTPPLLRGKGFGSAVTFVALQEAQAQGYESAWIWSSPMGQSVYRKLGFVAADFGIREYRWQRKP